MEKKQILELLISQVEQDLRVMKDVARATYDAATNEESKPENEYDTRALEASYLAGAQAKRAGELDFAISVLKKIVVREFRPEDEISATALVEVEIQGKRMHYFILPLGGGFSVQTGGQQIQVITPTSNFGEALIGLRVGESDEIEIGEQVRKFKVLSVR